MGLRLCVSPTPTNRRLDKGHFDCNYDDDDKDDDDDDDDKLVACSCRNLLFPVWTWTDGGV